MFCKWCGENLTSYDTKCKRCGREVPPLSDCGGFYDLVSNVKKPVDVQPTLAPAPAVPTIPKRKKTNVKRILIGLITLAVALILAIALLFLVIALSKIKQSTNETKVISVPVPAIEEKHVILSVVLCEDDATKYAIDDAIYGLSQEPENIKWKYRFGKTSFWNEVPEEAFSRTDNAEITDLFIDETWLQEQIANNEGQLEFRCEIYSSNTEDNSLRIVIDGIKYIDETKTEG